MTQETVVPAPPTEGAGPPGWAVAFVDAIAKLPPGPKAQLRRAAGGTLAEARNIVGIIGLISAFAGARKGWDRDAFEERMLLLASLLAHDKRAGSGGPTPRDFGATMHRVWQAGAAERADPADSAIGRRLSILLNAEFDGPGGGEMAYRLRQAVRLALSAEGVRVNWPQLADDLLHWDGPGRRVQKRWARSFIDPRESEETTTEGA